MVESGAVCGVLCCVLWPLRGPQNTLELVTVHLSWILVRGSRQRSTDHSSGSGFCALGAQVW